MSVRRAAVFVGYALVALLLQTSLVPLLTGGKFTVNLLTIYVVYLGMRRQSVWGVVGAFLLGYLQDTVSGTLYGLNAFAMTLVYLAVYRTSRHVWVENTVSQVVVVGLADALKQLATGLILAAVWGTGALPAFMEMASVSVLATAVVSPVVFVFLERIHEFAFQEEG
ncbi:MAG: rod shape-determining protein MreD [Candidatus Binatia bacterium]|nr:rod shape-determining protein MreD [Candidatus Binatia bacterium]